VKYRQLGNSGLRLSTVGLGSWLTYDDAGGGAGAARACFQRAFELGVNFFDTANEYGHGSAEEVVGAAISDLPRHELVLATKVYWPMGDGPNDWGLSRKHIVHQIDESLRRLGVDYVDLYQCHRYDTHTPLHETCETMSDLVRRGKVLYWGVSEWTAPQLRDALAICRQQGFTAPVSNQPQYSALWRTIEREILPVSKSLGLGTVVWSPLAMGILTGKYTSVDNVPDGSRGARPSFAFNSANDTLADMPYFNQPTLNAVQALSAVADQAGCTLSQLALAWCLRDPGVTAVITGATRPAQIEETAIAADLELADGILAAVTDGLRDVADFTAGPAVDMDSWPQGSPLLKPSP
jgi:aryl-alcohol dehydrogenase-like predicted oxidoreductase